MTVHLLRLAVGAESLDDVRRFQAARIASLRQQTGEDLLQTYTRNVPRRAEELIDGGSIYWVIKSLIRVRQRVLGVDRITDKEGRDRCALTLDPNLVLVEPRPQKAFQGWRYLRPEDAPPDVGRGGDSSADLPDDLAAELRDLGLI